MERFGKNQNRVTLVPNGCQRTQPGSAGRWSHRQGPRSWPALRLRVTSWGETLLCPFITPSAPLQLPCVLQGQPWVRLLLPQTFLLPFSVPLGSFMEQDTSVEAGAFMWWLLAAFCKHPVLAHGDGMLAGSVPACKELQQ